MNLDLQADLNAEDDEGLNWTLLEHARDPDRVRPGAILTAGSSRFWSWVRIVRVDEDGQVHFQQLSNSEVEALQPRRLTDIQRGPSAPSQEVMDMIRTKMERDPIWREE